MADTDIHVYPAADYTGATDSRVAVQQAIQAATTDRKTVRLHPGIIRLDGDSLRARNYTRVVGAGPRHTRIVPYGYASGFTLSAPAADQPLESLLFSDIEFDGSQQTLREDGTGANTVLKGLFIEYMNRVTVRDIWVHDTGGTGMGIDFITGVIDNVWADNCGRMAGPTSGGSSGIGIGVGKLNTVWEPLTITNCHTSGNARYGIFLETQNGETPGGISVSNNTARGNRYGFGDCGATGTTWTGNHAYENERAGFVLDPGTMTISRPSTQSSFTGNWAAGNGQDGLHAFGGDFSGLTITGNQFTDNHYYGIRVTVPAGVTIDGLTIVGNQCSGNRLGGIMVEGGGDLTNVRIEGNTGGVRVDARIRSGVVQSDAVLNGPSFSTRQAPAYALWA